MASSRVSFLEHAPLPVPSSSARVVPVQQQRPPLPPPLKNPSSTFYPDPVVSSHSASASASSQHVTPTPNPPAVSSSGSSVSGFSVSGGGDGANIGSGGRGRSCICEGIEYAPPVGSSPPKSSSGRGGFPASPASGPSFEDVVERIVNAAESRQAADRESSCAYGEDAADGNCAAAESANGGPLTVLEISELALLCTSSSPSASSPSHSQQRRPSPTSTSFGGNRVFPAEAAGGGSGAEPNFFDQFDDGNAPDVDDEEAAAVGWASVNGDILSLLTPMLQAHVASAGRVDLVGEGRAVISRWAEGGPAIKIDQWLYQSVRYTGENSAPLGSLGDYKAEPGQGHRRLQILHRGLEAADVLLSIMSSSGVDVRAVEDDSIESCVSLIKNHLQKNVMPALSNTGHLGAAAVMTGGGGGDADTVEPDSSLLPPGLASTPAKRSKKNGGSGTLARDVVARHLRKVYHPILSTIGSLASVMERAETFLVALAIDDRLLFALSAAALSTLSIDAALTVRADAPALAGVVQISAINLVVAIIRRYPRHRSIVVEDLFPLMLKIPTSKKSIRTFAVRKSTGARGGGEGSDDAKPSSTSSLSSASSMPGSSDQDHIQAITALTLHLVQSCVIMPFQSNTDSIEEGDADADADADADPDSDGDDEEDAMGIGATAKNAKKKNDKSGLENCVTMCNQFAVQMLQRCSRKGEDGGASEFRPILSNLVDDLLLVRMLPEYPCAEMLLLSLCRKMSQDLIRSSSAGKNKSDVQTEVTYLSTALDAFGRITSAVAGILLQQRENPFSFPGERDSDDEEEEEVNRCFCGRANLDTFMVDCDRCHAWFHGSCVGITKDTVPEIWLCDDCTMQTAVLDQAQVFASRKVVGAKLRGLENELTDGDEKHVLRQLLLNFLTTLCDNTESPLADRARECMIASWVKDLLGPSSSISGPSSKEGKGNEHPQPQEGGGSFDAGLVRSHVIAQWNRSSAPRPHTKRHPRQYLSNEGNSRIMSALVSSSELELAFPRLLGVILLLMGDEKNSLRKLAVKAILQVVNVDPSLMTQPSVKKAVSRRFLDHAISVREAAVSLVGDYVIQSPKLADAFHSALLDRIVDSGISVRKRAVKIFRDILLSNPTYSGRSAACNEMLTRAADRKEDDHVRDLIHETFHTLWFTGKAPGIPGAKEKQRCNEAAQQMVEVVKVSGSPDGLTSLMKGLLFGFTEGDKDKKVVERKRRQVSSRNQCGSLVSSLIELLLAFEDNRKHEDDDGKELVALLSTLSVFSQSYPELLVPHVDTLLPYLKGDNGAKQYEPAIVSNVSGILSRITPHFSGPELNRHSVGDLPQDLVNIAYKFPGDSVSSAVEALATLANHHDAPPGNVQEKKLLKLAVQFYSYLLKTKDVTNDLTKTKKSTRDNIRRALSALGSICRFYECEVGNGQHSDDPSQFSIITNISGLQFAGHAMSNACFAMFLEYMKKEDAVTKCLALRAMTGVFIARPRVVLLAEKEGIVSSAMSERSPPSVQLESLRCWREILLSEEKRIESGEAKEKMDSKSLSVSTRLSGDQDGDSCISGSVLTTHSPRLFEMTRSMNEKVRHGIVDLIGHLLRQGLINPMETVPYLLALQGDIKSPSTRSLALKLLIIEGEKRPDMLRQRICAGIKESFHFQRHVYPRVGAALPVTALLENSTDGARVAVETIFDSVFVESSIRNKKAQRQGLYKSIISLFEKTGNLEDIRSNGKTKKHVQHEESLDMDRLPHLAFASQILAHLPYNSAADPLFIIYHLSCLTTLEGAELLARFATLVGNDECDPNPGEDDLERAAKSENPSCSELAARLVDSNFDVENFSVMCVEASVLTILLRLKIFLCKAFNLSETRMLEYLPSEKERINEKGISIQEGTPKFDSFTEAVFNRTGKSGSKREVDINATIRTYATFRMLMREGQSDDSTLLFDEVGYKKRSGMKRNRGDSQEDPLE